MGGSRGLVCYFTVPPRPVRWTRRRQLKTCPLCHCTRLWKSEANPCMAKTRPWPFFCGACAGKHFRGSSSRRLAQASKKPPAGCLLAASVVLFPQRCRLSPKTLWNPTQVKVKVWSLLERPHVPTSRCIAAILVLGLCCPWASLPFRTVGSRSAALHLSLC